MSKPLPPLDDQSRFDMQSMAMTAERRNRPRGAMMLAFVVLAASVLAVGLGWRSHTRAQQNLRRSASDAGQILALSKQITAIQAARAESGEDEETPGTEGLSVALVEQLARSVGLKNFNQYPKGSPEIQGGRRILAYEYRGVRDESMDRLVKWLQLVLERVDGVEVRSLSFAKRGINWELTVRLSTLEGQI